MKSPIDWGPRSPLPCLRTDTVPSLSSRSPTTSMKGIFISSASRIFLPADQSASFLYRDDESLVDRLRALLCGPVGAGGSLGAHVGRYDWEHQAPAYDDFFEALASGGGERIAAVKLRS